ncbi:hypothetical protein TNCV_3645091 [Trichonephila clavipes]|nr:hypothetical protein TNCV_3645091 [Trichonephila clavipes]
MTPRRQSTTTVLKIRVLVVIDPCGLIKTTLRITGVDSLCCARRCRAVFADTCATIKPTACLKIHDMAVRYYKADYETYLLSLTLVVGYR